MKKILIVSLLLVQGLWAAAAADGVGNLQQRTSFPTLKFLAGQKLFRDAVYKDNLMSVINAIVQTHVYATPQEVILNAYLAWLNAHRRASIIVVQNGRQSCQEICIRLDAIPVEWEQLTVDISRYVGPDRPINNFHLRRGTIAHLIHTNRMSEIASPKLDLSDKELTICDLWNLPDQKEPTITRIILDRNFLRQLTPDSFAGFGSLVGLSVRSNKLTQLPLDIFADLLFLQKIYLENNKLTVVEPNTFARLPALTELRLSGNPELKLKNPDNLEALKTERPE